MHRISGSARGNQRDDIAYNGCWAWNGWGLGDDKAEVQVVESHGGNSRTCRRRFRVPAVVLPLLAATLVPAAAAQQREGVRARMEYDRVLRYSGSGPESRPSAPERPCTGAGHAAGWGGADGRRRSALAPAGAASKRVRPIHGDGSCHGDRHPPEDNDIVYAGGAQGGVWKSEDAGDSWTPLTDGECSLAMGSIAIDPVDPEIVYAGTGEQNYQRDSYYGCGVLRTLDGGTTWEQLGTDPFVRKTATTGGAYIARVVVDRATAGSADSTTVLVASSFGLFRSTDSGRTWEEVLEGRATDLLAHPTDSTVFFAAVQEEGVYRSTDSGEEWDEASTDMSLDGAKRINLAISPSDPDVLYATVETDDAEGLGSAHVPHRRWRGYLGTGGGGGRRLLVPVLLHECPGGEP